MRLPPQDPPTSIIGAIEGMATRIELFNDKLKSIRLREADGKPTRQRDLRELKALEGDIQAQRVILAKHQARPVPNEFKDRAAFAQARLERAIAIMGGAIDEGEIADE